MLLRPGFLWLVVAIGAACSPDRRGRPGDDGSPAPAAAPFDPSTITWRDHHLSDIGITMPVPVQGKTTEGRFGGDARYLRSAVGPLVLTLWHGPGQSMDSWKNGLPPKSQLGEETQVTACGRPARRIQAQLASRRIRRGRPAAIKLDEPKPTSAPSAADVVELPPRTVVAVAFEQKGRPVMLTWDIEAAGREPLETQEKQFFAGLRCE